MIFEPDRIYIDESVINSHFTQNILAKFPDREHIILNASDQGQSFKNITLSAGKKHLYLKAYQGAPVKLCPGLSKDLLCCNYYVIDLVENCPLECTYCILQAFLNQPLIVFHINMEEIIDRLKTEIDASPEQIYRIGTGEHSDSLAMDHIFGNQPLPCGTFRSFQQCIFGVENQNRYD